jgi:hypothetical protein
MNQPPGDGTPVTQRASAHSMRRWLSWGLVALTCLSLILTTVGLWGRAMLFNTDRFVGVVEPIVRDPEVAAVLSARASADIVVALELHQRAWDVLPERAGFLAAPLTRAARDLIASELGDLLRNPTFLDAWLSILRFIHSQLVAILRNQSTRVQLQDGQVYLNLFPVIDQGFRLVEQLGLLPDGVQRPDLSNVTPAQGRQDLSQALGVTLPPTFGQVTVAQSESLDDAQRAVGLFDLITVIVLPALTALLAGLALLVSPSRRRTLIQLGVAAAAGVILAWAAIDLVSQQVVNSIKNEPTGYTIARDAAEALTASLLEFARTVAIVAGLIATIDFLAGSGDWFRRAFETARGLGDRAEQANTVVRWVAAHADGLRIGGLAAVMLALVVLDLTWAQFFWLVALLAVYEIGLTILGARAAAGVTPAVSAGG